MVVGLASVAGPLLRAAAVESGLTRGGPPSRPFRRRLVLNTVVTGASNAWAIVVTLVGLPLVLHGLGATWFGRWVLLQTLSATTGWLGALDAGMATASTRAVAARLSAGDRSATGGAAGTALVVFAVLGVMGAVLVAAVGPWLLPALAKAGGSSRGPVVAAVELLALQVLCELVLQGVQSTLEGLQRLDLSRGTDMFRRAMFVAGTAAAALVTHRLVGVEIGGLAATAVGTAAAVGVLARAGRGLRPRWSTAECRTMARYAAVVAVLRPISTLYALMDRVICGVVLGPAAVAVVEVATQIQAGVDAVLSASSAALVAGSAWLEARTDTDRLVLALRRGTRYSVLATWPLALGVIVLARPGVELWVGHRFLGAATPASVAAGAIAVAALAGAAANVLTGTGEGAVIVRISTVGVLVDLAVSVVLVHPLGVAGVFVGTLVSYLVTTPWLIGAACRRLGIHAAELVREAVVPVLPPLVALAVVLAAVTVAGTGPGVRVGVGAGVGLVVLVVAAWRWSVPSGELGDLVAAIRPDRGSGPTPDPGAGGRPA